MISVYFAEVENILQAFTNIRTYALQTKVYNTTQGYIGGSVVFQSKYRLDFIEVKDTAVVAKLKYRYQYSDAYVFTGIEPIHRTGVTRI